MLDADSTNTSRSPLPPHSTCDAANLTASVDLPVPPGPNSTNLRHPSPSNHSCRARSSFFRTCSPSTGAATTLKASTEPARAAAIAARLTVYLFPTFAKLSKPVSLPSDARLTALWLCRPVVLPLTLPALTV